MDGLKGTAKGGRKTSWVRIARGRVSQTVAGWAGQKKARGGEGRRQGEKTNLVFSADFDPTVRSERRGDECARATKSNQHSSVGV